MNQLVLDSIEPANPLPARLSEMYRKYGRTENEICRDCAFLVMHWPNKRYYYKCSKYADTRSAASDWRIRWQACGLFQREPTPIRRNPR